MRVRRATILDAPAIQTVARAFEAQPLPAWRNRPPSRVKVEGSVPNYDRGWAEDQVVLLCENDFGLALGYAHVGPAADPFTGEPQALLYYLAAAPGFQNQGVGRLLMEAVEALAREQGAASVVLTVFAPNARGRAFYACAGFEEDAVIMAKPLA